MIFSVICLQDNWNYCKFAKAAMKNQTGSNNIIQTLKYKSIMTKKEKFIFVSTVVAW